MKATKLLTLFVVPILLFQLGGCDAESGLEKTNKLMRLQMIFFPWKDWSLIIPSATHYTWTLRKII